MKLRVVGAQMPVSRDIDANREALLRAVNHASRREADVLLTPEGSLSGYTSDFPRKRCETALEIVTKRASEKRIALVLGTCFYENDGKCYNQLRFYEKDGSYLGFHSKILLCGSLSPFPKGEIEDFSSSPLRTFAIGGIVCGGLICNDLWANPECTPMDDPHLTQQLSRMGARVVFHAVNGGRNGSAHSTQTVRNFHESNLLMRAKAGRLHIVTCDNAFPLHLPCSSPGGIVGPQGSWLVKAPEKGEHFFFYEIEGLC
jgi:predicted amidohydrolase